MRRMHFVGALALAAAVGITRPARADEGVPTIADIIKMVESGQASQLDQALELLRRGLVESGSGTQQEHWALALLLKAAAAMAQQDAEQAGRSGAPDVYTRLQRARELQEQSNFHANNGRESALSQAAQAMSSGDAGQAVQLLQTLSQANPNDQRARLLLGRSQVEQGARQTGAGRRQALDQAAQTLQTVETSSSDPIERSMAARDRKAIGLRTPVLNQHVMGREVDPLLSQEFKRKLSGRTPIGGRICGIAAIAMVAEMMGLVDKWTPQRSKELIEGPNKVYIPNAGTDRNKVPGAINRLGGSASWMGDDIGRAKQELQAGKPVLLGGRGLTGVLGHLSESGDITDGRAGPYRNGHYMVIVGFRTPEEQSAREKSAAGGQNTFVVNDPNLGKRIIVTESGIRAYANGDSMPSFLQVR